MSKYVQYLVTLFVILLWTEFLSADDKCATCHQNMGDKPALLYKKDVHSTKGITCADCHGGNPGMDEMEQAMNVAAGYKGIPKGDEISNTCANCHSSSEKMKSYGSTLPVDQLENLKLSVHGKLSVSGKEHIVQCVTCHSVHEIVSVKNPASPVYPLNVVNTCSKCHSDATFMRTYNPSLPVDQHEKYRTSVHGILNLKGDPKAAECASCHGSHGIRSSKDAKSNVYAVNLPATCSSCHSNQEYMKDYQLPTDQFDKFAKSVHGLALLEKHDVGAPACNDCHGNHGATPPGVESISKVCGTCHALNADLFASSPHKKAFDERELPECETCHSNHDIAAATKSLLGVGPDAICSSCHSETENTKGFLVAKSMRHYIDSLDSQTQAAQNLVDDAEQKGMEVSESVFKLREAHQARLQARTAVHSFNENQFQEVISKGLIVALNVKTEGRVAIDEFYFRRWGLGVATLIITILSIALYITIRRIEQKQKLNKTNQY